MARYLVDLVVEDQDGHSEPIPKPIGGSCTDTSQCGAGLMCIEGICISVPAAAPTASPYGIAALLLALGGFGAWRLSRRAAA